MKRQSNLTVAAIIIMLAVSSTPAQIVYNLIDLGTLSGRSSYAYSINNDGQIVGRSYNAAGRMCATLFDSTGGGKNIDLGALAVSDSFASSINNSGQVVGHSFISGVVHHATLFDSSGGGWNIDLGTLGGDRSHASSINDNGQIVGWADPVSGDRHATLFDPTGNGNNIDLGTLGGEESLASSINNSGQIVGGADTIYHTPSVPPVVIKHATLFDPTGAGNNIDLGTLPGFWYRPLNSGATSINNCGQIVGGIYRDPFDWWTFSAVLFDPTGEGNNIELSDRASVAYSINNNGQIVGWAYRSIDGLVTRRAILFDPTGQLNNTYLDDLIDPTLGWTLREAHCINDNGWIVGYGENPDGHTRAYLLTPEPATLLLLGLGAALLKKR